MPRGPRDTSKRTNVGRKKATSGALKKTTAKGAYAPAKKKAFRKRRQPFVETKKREHTIIAFQNDDGGIDPAVDPLYAQQPMEWANVPNDDAYTHFNLASYYRMKQGLGEEDMVGDACYSRYLKVKLDLRFPGNMNLMLKPNKLYVVQGWIVAPLNTNASRGVFGGTGTDSKTTIASDLMLHVSNSVKQFFDQNEDRLRFMPKVTTDVKILRKDLISPNLQSQLGLPPSLRGEQGFVGTNGSIPDVHRSYTWTVNRKVHYTQGTGQDGKAKAQDNSSELDIQNMYPNNSWIPFLILYSPDFAVYKNADGSSNASGSEVNLQARYNDCHWFSDS